MDSGKNPLDAYLAEKTAGRGADFLRGLGGAMTPEQAGKRFGEGALAVGGGLAAAGVGLAAQKLHDAATKARDFRVMLEHNPDLAEKHEENPRLFNQAFSTLRTFNPQFSRDPIVAGSYLRQMMSDPVHAGGVVEKSLDYRDKMKSPLMSAFGGGKKK